jgi:hypothetical protein
MENPFKNWTQKDWLYAGGATASVIALIWFAASQRQIAIPSGTVTDVQNAQTPTIMSGVSPANYINYNTYDTADVVPVAAGADTAPNVTGTSGCGGCCDKAGSGCTGPSALSTGDTYSSVNDLISYYQNTNPVYVELQKVQLAKYAALFSTGESYSRGGQNVGVAGIA